MKHFKPIFYSFGVILLFLGLYALIAPPVNFVVSNPATSDSLSDKAEVPTAHTSQPGEETTGTKKTEEVITYSTTADLPIVENAIAMEELTRLQQINLDFLTRPGWLHFKQKTWDLTKEDQQETESRPGFNSYGMFPATQTYENWRQIVDEEGTFGYGDFIVNSGEDGNPLQIVVSDLEGNGGNLTLLERGLSEFYNVETSAEENITITAKVKSQIQNIIQWFQDAEVTELNPIIKAGYVIVDGIEEYQILIQTAVISEPYEIQGIPEPANGFISLYRIDPVTGNIKVFTEEAIGISGKTYKLYSQITLVREVVETMPEDVQERYNVALERYQELIKEDGN